MADAQKIKASFMAISPHASDIAFWFYAHLFAHHHDARDLFPPDMRIQRERFVTALVRIVGDADRVERLVPYLKELGRNHAVRYHIETRHYQWVGESLLATLAHFLGERWTPELAQDWAEVYGIVADAMIIGAEEGYGAHVSIDGILTQANVDGGRFQTGWLLRGVRPEDAEQYRSIASGVLEQAISDNADLLRQLEEADKEIRRLRDVYYVANSDLHGGPGPVDAALQADGAAWVDDAEIQQMITAQRAAEANASRRRG